MLVIGLIAVLSGVWFLLSSLAAREAANDAAKAHCTRLRLQFLDGTVAFKRLVVTPPSRGGWSMHRVFSFEFSADSMTRCLGVVTMQGKRVLSIELPPGIPG